MTAPILAKSGAYKCEDDNVLYMVFPFVNGQTIGDEKLMPAQARELGRITARLHAYGAEIPVPTDGLKETFDVSFCDTLNGWIRSGQHPILDEAMAPYAKTIFKASKALRNAADVLRESDLRYVLCHTDIHGWNLMQSDTLVLIDWEGLKLAPAEADLFSLTDTFFFGYAWDDFMSAYRSVHSTYVVNPEAMRFYRLRRRLEDIYAFAGSIIFDKLTQEEMRTSLDYLKRECALLNPC
jgi:Ser/Thr protein kinase RdoA (MazF antagonist)